MENSSNQPLQTGRYDMCVIDGGHTGAIAIESEPGRSVVISRGTMATNHKGDRQFVGQSRIMLDARDLPRLLNGLGWAHENALLPVVCPNGCDGDAHCNECP